MGVNMSTEHISRCLKTYANIIRKIAWPSRVSVRPGFVQFSTPGPAVGGPLSAAAR